MWHKLIDGCIGWSHFLGVWVAKFFPSCLSLRVSTKFLLPIFLLSISLNSIGQPILTLPDAIGKALEKNLDIKLAQNALEQAKNENYAGNAGMRPSVMLNLNDNPSLTNVNQELANGQTITRSNVLSNAFGGNVALGYTIFDGMRMYATRKRLQELEEMGQIQVKSVIQNTVAQVIAGYAEIIRQKSLLKVLQSLEQVSRERLSLVEARKTSGLANNADLFLVRLELDQRRQAADVQKVQIVNAKTALNRIMNEPDNAQFEVSETFVEVKSLNRAELETRISKNPNWLVAEKQVLIAQTAKKEAKSAFYPWVRLNAQVAYNRSQTQAGFLLVNQNYGTTGGLGLSLPLYTGQVNKRNYQGADIVLRRSQLQQEQVKLNLSNGFEVAWENYSAFTRFVEEDKQAVETARQLLSLVEQRYKAGEGTVLDFREVQRTYQEISNRYINNQFNLKLAETDLLNLTGGLVGE